MNLSYKYRLKPTPTQETALQEQLHLCRHTYNNLLEYCLSERRVGRGTPTHKALTYLLPAMKQRKPELNTVFSQVLQNVAKRVRSGFECYWARKRAGLKAHLPRFRGEDRYDSLTYPQFGFKLDGSNLKLSKIGELKMIQHRPVEGKVKTLTVTRSRAGKWFAVFASEVEAKPIRDRLPAVGVDFGLGSLVALSDGSLIEAPRSYRKAEMRLGRAQRCLSRKVRGSRNREKARIRAASICERVSNQRRDFAFKVVEDLKIANMVRNRHLSKSISDAGWGLVRNALTYRAERSLGVTAFVNPPGTSQICSGCGCVVRKDLSVRTHHCPECGLTLDRDVNAALNVLKRGLRLGLGQADFMPVGGVADTRLGGAGQVASVSQEARLL